MKPSLDINPQFKQALQLIKQNKKSLFITGKAGTGKSTLLDYFCSHTDKKPVVLAPTGVAALNVKGQTIHSFFKFYIDVTPEKIKKKKTSPKNSAVYKNLKTLIIDEVSMVRADLLDCVDTFLRLHGPKKNKAFGGVQMIFVGDLYQLPPVVTSKEKDLFAGYYKTPYFFSARAFDHFEIEIIELIKVYRQKDPDFINLLNRIRNSSLEAEDIDRLNSRYLSSFKPEKDMFYISLTSMNKTADRINEEHLKNLKSRAYQSSATIEGDFGKEYFPTNPHLQFKTGSQVMLLNNDQKKRWVNGSIGIIEEVARDEEHLQIRLYPSGKLVSVYQFRWEIYRFFFSKENQAIHSELAGAFTQFPLRLAWAITIHKSQGKTFERVIIDMGRGMFVCGQAYVALSRCVSFEGIVLKSPVKKYHIRTDYRIFDFLTAYQYQKAEMDMPLKDKIQFIQQTIDDQKQLKITYLKANDTKSQRTVTPIEVGWQVYCSKKYQGMRAFCSKAGEERMFRVDRILKLKRSSEVKYTDPG